jgi:hypothetical protein
MSTARVSKAPRERMRRARVNPLRQLSKLGQSVWLDYVRRSLIISGELAHLISSTRPGDARAELIHSRTFTGTSSSYACADLGTTGRG